MKLSRILLFPPVNICKLLDISACALRYTSTFQQIACSYGLLLQYKM
jgi:hypothetical protein